MICRFVLGVLLASAGAWAGVVSDPPDPAVSGGWLVEEAALATGMRGRAPQGVSDQFPPETDKLYCYSRLAGGKSGDEIMHVWFRNDQERARVVLRLGGSPWRTFSSKILGPEDAGAWRVEIRREKVLLKSLACTVAAKRNAAPIKTRKPSPRASVP